LLPPRYCQRDRWYVSCLNLISFSRLIALLGVASDAVHDQVMRHDPFTGVFNGAYINHIVRFNVQDALRVISPIMDSPGPLRT
jgi:hypothetical protein